MAMASSSEERKLRLSNSQVLQTIEKGKRKLELGDMSFEVQYADQPQGLEKRAEIFIWSDNHAEILLYPNATLFSVRHELCHAKLFRMGAPLTNTAKDRKLFPASEEYLRAVVIVEWYVNELQRKFFGEYYTTDRFGSPRSPPYPKLPKLPNESFTTTMILRPLRPEQ
jgi:hypothetical protein